MPEGRGRAGGGGGGDKQRKAQNLGLIPRRGVCVESLRLETRLRTSGLGFMSCRERRLQFTREEFRGLGFRV